ncbi:MAG TPA: hypothetical protein VGX02_02730 [Candidatus Eremiobacteraceae bacterium]|nr:hypothetical protein [Candidatus Eremiobacteraceae bacterium]
MKPRPKGLCIGFCILLLVAAQARASCDGAPQQWADVEVMAISCPEDSDQVPTIQASAFNRRDAPLPTDVTALRIVKVGANVYQVTFSLPAGTYFLRAVTAHCRSSQMGTLIAGATRHFSMTMSATRMTALSPSCAIAGTLPFKGISVELVSGNGTKVPIVLDGYVYDAERLGWGTYTLRLNLGEGAKAEYVFDLSKEKGGELCDRTLIRNISMDDLKRDAHRPAPASSP